MAVITSCKLAADDEAADLKQDQNLQSKINNKVPVYSVLVKDYAIQCLQCFDAVGWAAGRASGL